MEIFKYSLSYNFLKHLYLSFKKNHSPIRLIHNYFLIGKKIQGTTIDLGAGEGSNTSYYEYLDCKEAKIERSDFFKSSDVKIDLENKLDLKDQCCDNVILFNTLDLSSFDIIFLAICLSKFEDIVFIPLSRKSSFTSIRNTL